MLSHFGLALIFGVLILPLGAQEVLASENLSVTDTTAISSKQIDKTEIENWILANRIDLEESVFSSAPLQLDLGDLYHNGYFYLGRYNLAMPERNGFETFSGIFSPALYYASFNSLYPFKDYRGTVNFTNRTYPFAPVLTSVDAALGDYDHHYARINFAKNELFSYSELEYQGDLLSQNGLWSDIISAETSMKHRLSRNGKLFSWETEYASWNKDIAMNELLPVYWQLTNFKIAYKLQQFYAAVGLPWLKLKMLQESETASATVFAEKYNRQSTRMQLNSAQNFNLWQYQAIYEHCWNKGDNAFSGFYNAEFYEDKLAFYCRINSPLQIDLKGDWLNWKRGRLFSDVSYSTRTFTLGANYSRLLGEDPSPLKVKNIYNASEELDLIDIAMRRQVSLYCSCNFLPLKPLVSLGIKDIEQKADSTWLNVKEQQPFLRLTMNADFSWKNWEFNARPEWIISKYYDNLTENPEYRFQSVQQIKYHLLYNNAIVAGCGFYGSSGYYAANAVNPVLIEASTVFDVWAGVDISRYFQIRAGFKNINSSALYGAYPVPVSVFAKVLWLYLN